MNASNVHRHRLLHRTATQAGLTARPKTPKTQNPKTPRIRLYLKIIFLFKKMYLIKNFYNKSSNHYEGGETAQKINDIEMMPNNIEAN